MQPPPFTTSPVHPERGRDYRATEGAPHVLVIHTSEQPSATTQTAEALARFIASPPTGTPPNMNVASYHWAVDLDSIVHMQWCDGIDDCDRIAFHAPPNWRGEGICLTGRAARDWTGTKDGVDDWPQLELAARLAAWRCQERGWPARRLTPQQLQAGEKGICGHVDISRAFGLSDHTDPGVAFPWAWFIQRVLDLMEPEQPPDEEDEDVIKWYVRCTDPTNRPEGLYCLDGAGATFVLASDTEGALTMLATPGLVEVMVSPAQYAELLRVARAGEAA